jgi:hypothetical protein
LADVLAMGLYGFVIDVQLVGYFPGAKAVGDHYEDFLFPSSEDMRAILTLP